MDSKQEIELFSQLSSHNRLKDWLSDRLESEYSALVQAADIDQLRRAQGRAQLLKSMLSLLDIAPGAAKRQV